MVSASRMYHVSRCSVIIFANMTFVSGAQQVVTGAVAMCYSEITDDFTIGLH